MTWNPDAFEISPEKWKSDIERIATEGYVVGGWSCGNSKSIEVGDIAYLIRYASDRGIVARGIVDRSSYEGDHYSERGKKSNYVDVRWVEQVPIDNRLTMEELESAIPGETWIRYASGSSVKPEYSGELANLWERKLREQGFSVAREFGQRISSDVCAVCGFHASAAWSELGSEVLVPSDDGAVMTCRNCQVVMTSASPTMSWTEARSRISSQF